jgi:biopolymer transport protein ExbD
MARKKRSSGEFNASSMADIAFLLLVFFLMVTTIDTDKGILRRLPPMPDENQKIEIDIKKRNVFEIRVNSNDQLLVEGEYATIAQLKDMTKRFILNYGNDRNLSDNPQLAVVSLKNDRGTSYDIYIQVQNELTAAYNEVRNAEAKKRFGADYENLSKSDQNEINNEFPMKISEAEPENIGGK